MGERGAKNEPATPKDIEQMAAVVKEAIEAGALGFSSSRTLVHRAIDGEPVPGTFAAEDELFGIGEALREAGAGIFELAPAGVMGEDLSAPNKEVAWMRELSTRIGRPVSFALLQVDQQPDHWRRDPGVLRRGGKAWRTAAAPGGLAADHAADRPADLSHPFSFRPSYAALAEWPLDERVRELSKPDVKAKILTEDPVDEDPLLAFVFQGMHKIFVLDETPDYEPTADRSIEAIAKAGRPRARRRPLRRAPEARRQGAPDGRPGGLRGGRPRGDAARCSSIPRARPSAWATAAPTVARSATRQHDDLPAHPLDPRPRARSEDPHRVRGQEDDP